MALDDRSATLLHDALARIAQEVDACFDTVLPVPGDPRDRLIEAMRYAAIGGGKRLRPLLVASVAGLYGVDRNVAVRVGSAIEAIHVYSLIHDDLPCMDNDALRHGKPTTHLAFDEATAVLAGDSLLALAFEILSDPNLIGDPFTRIELVRTLALASGAQGMAGGQMMDIVAETTAFDLSTVTRLQQLKTGALLGAAVEMGAILGPRRAPICAGMPAISAWRSRSSMICSMPKATRRRQARRCARMPTRASRPLCRCWGSNARERRRTT